MIPGRCANIPLQVPQLCALVDEIRKVVPLCRLGQVKFSLISPGTTVLPHCGPSNMRLRLHLGLRIPGRCVHLQDHCTH